MCPRLSCPGHSASSIAPIAKATFFIVYASSAGIPFEAFLEPSISDVTPVFPPRIILHFIKIASVTDQGGRADVVHTAPSTNWAKMDLGETGFPLHFVVINRRDGFREGKGDFRSSPGPGAAVARRRARRMDRRFRGRIHAPPHTRSAASAQHANSLGAQASQAISTSSR